MTGSDSSDARASTTREAILTRLLREGRTVTGLADELELSRNAVRSQLTALERDGLVEVVRRERGGVGKPAFVYGITAEGERSFPRAYGALLAAVVATATAELGQEPAEGLLREAGRRIARREPLPEDASWDERLASARAVVEELGGKVELRDTDDGLVIRGFSCPLAEVVAEEPESCALLEALLTELLQMPVEERCEKGPRPRCRFHLPAASTRSR